MGPGYVCANPSAWSHNLVRKRAKYKIIVYNPVEGMAH